MAKDKGLVRRVLQILSPEDQETLAILHDPPLMEELLRRQETLADIRAAGLMGGVVAPSTGAECSPQAPTGLRVFPAVLDELAELPPAVREALLQVHLPALAAAPEGGLALTQLFQGLWVSICMVNDIDYRIIYEIDPPGIALTVLLIGTWKSLESRLEANEAP
jgi:hypothetical protein